RRSRGTLNAAGCRVTIAAGLAHTRRKHLSWAWAVSELGQFGGRCRDALYVGAEIDEQCGSLFDTGDRAETVLVVGDLVVYREALGRRLRFGSVERTGCQVTPGTGGVRAHCYKYAPVCGRGPHGIFCMAQFVCMAQFRDRPRTSGGCVSNRFRAGPTASRVELAQYLGRGRTR